MCLYYSSSIPIQRIWIPCILILCVLENFFDLSSWLSLNSTGLKNITTQLTAIILKSFKNALGRVLLLAASRGIGIIPSSPDSKNSSLYLLGVLYFIFDLVYQIPLKLTSYPGLIYLVVLSIPLIVLNTIIFFYIFSWFSKTVFRLKFYKQEYKLKLLKQFAVVLSLGGVLSLVWGTLEIIARFSFKKNFWWVNCLYFLIWDLIFFFVVTSLIVIWRVNMNSRLLADTQELRDEDHEISHEDEGKYGIELSRAQKK